MMEKPKYWKLDYSRHVQPGVCYYKGDLTFWISDSFLRIERKGEPIFRGLPPTKEEYEVLVKLLDL